MTDDEKYLTARGWVRCAPAWMEDNGRTDPIYADTTISVEEDGGAGWWGIGDALAIQRARDAVEERKCVADAIANAAARHSKSASGVTDEQKRAGVSCAADLALDEYRKRFGGQS